MSLSKTTVSLLALLAAVSLSTGGQKGPVIDVWLTNPDKSSLFELQRLPSVGDSDARSAPVIVVDEKQKYQTVDGFGFALTGGSAQHLIHMSPESRAAILRELFATDGRGIGVSYLRLTIGASDLNAQVFTYDEMPAGGADPELGRFDLGPDRADVIPVMKEILRINPKIKVLASPWSAPTWMKSNGNFKGGSLLIEYYPAYARYLAKYVQAMEAEGIHIDAITVQNEPLNPKNTPSMVMQASEQALFIKGHLGPVFNALELKTRIVLYDHNCDVPEYSLSILSDPEVVRYVDGSGFHLYGGKIEAMSQVHTAFPAKNLYFTEQMVTGSVETRPSINIARPMSRLIVGAMRNWSRNVLLWNLAADPRNEPHTNDGGCTMCQGAITIDGDKVSRNLAYYVIAHAAKFVRPGAVRIASTNVDDLPNVAFRNPDGRKVLLVVNTSPTTRSFTVRSNRKMTTSLNAGAAATYVW